ncbi:uncharacterized protein LOC132720715 [Ruditapes philippinarum]|uniref:uncharacterized protein LOC132720715 n=1 Tax=Ruditapes philippinarum TaxID=129788 RepID=UPI00295AA8C5|nr:uncharacterized protein LOC132720715 [Ruditapes philippinarum]
MFPKWCGVKKRFRVMFLIVIASGSSFFIGLWMSNPLKKELAWSGDTSNRKTLLFMSHHANSNQGSMRTTTKRSFEDMTRNQMNVKRNKIQKYQGDENDVSEEHIPSNKPNNKTLLFAKVFPLFQSATPEEFPTSDDRVLRIPHILHQIYVDEMIPDVYIEHIKSFIEYNPTWEYRFWTDASGRQFLQKHNPYLVKAFNTLGNGVKRSDLLRYAVLYEYGGFYADFDMHNFRSLNRTTMKYACIFPVEPFEHSSFLYHREFVINNAFMGCRPKHPFIKLLLLGLRNASPKGNPVMVTGPIYVTEKFIQYNHITNESVNRNKTDWSSNSPYFYKGEMKENDKNSVYVPNSQYFMDKIDPIHTTKTGVLTRLCGRVQTLSYLRQRGCMEYKSRRSVRKHRKYTFTTHHWYHIWHRNRTFVEQMKKVNIKHIVPQFILYPED